MILIPKGPGLPRDDHAAWAGVLVHPLGHAFVDAVDPRWDELFGHVLIPTGNHPPDLPKTIMEDRWIDRVVNKIVEYILKSIP